MIYESCNDGRYPYGNTLKIPLGQQKENAVLESSTYYLNNAEMNLKIHSQCSVDLKISQDIYLTLYQGSIFIHIFLLKFIIPTFSVQLAK